MDKMSKQKNVYPSGYLIFIEGDKNEWFRAFEWQKNEFMKAMKFGTMKTMCYPNPITKSEPFKEKGYKYRFIILNDWGPVFIENMNTKKQREIKYIELNKTDICYLQSL